jgi:hypothetical protein
MIFYFLCNVGTEIRYIKEAHGCRSLCKKLFTVVDAERVAPGVVFQSYVGAPHDKDCMENGSIPQDTDRPNESGDS